MFLQGRVDRENKAQKQVIEIRNDKVEVYPGAVNKQVSRIECPTEGLV